MTTPTVYIAHSRGKHGFTCYSHERYKSERYGAQKSGWHIVSDETLESAMRELQARIAHDWQSLGLSVPEIVDCGRVSRINGDTHCYGGAAA